MLKETFFSLDRGNPKARKRTIIIIAALLATMLTALALGLGLGLGLPTTACASSSSSSSSCTKRSPSSESNNPTPRDVWQPAVGISWQIVLHDPLDLSSGGAITPDVAVYDIDLFTNTADGTDPASVIGTLHADGRKVVCYFSGGTHEPYRPDSDQYDEADLGASLPEWPDEKWVDLRSENVRNIVMARVDMAAEVGCDAIDVDNVDGYQNQNGGGFQPPLTQADSIDFILATASHAASLGLAFGLKNALDIIPEVARSVQFAVNEECADWDECAGNLKEYFVEQGKPVLHIEYPVPEDPDRETGWDEATRADHCSFGGVDHVPEGFSTVLKTYDLDGWVQFCDGSLHETPVQE